MSTEFWVAVAYALGATVTARRALYWGNRYEGPRVRVRVVAAVLGAVWPLWWLFLVALTAAAALAKAAGSGEQS